jgi:uncharacterized RDD family membrane protein YckC
MSMAAIRAGGPSVGLPEGVFLAPLGRRVAAFAIEAVVPYLLVLLAGILLLAGAPGWLVVLLYLLPLAWAVLLWWMYATRAAGPGMRLMHLQVVGMRDGRPIGWWRALLRALILSICCGVLVLGIVLLVLMLRQVRRQGWHDLAADSVVIEERTLAPRRTEPGIEPLTSAPVSPSAGPGPAGPGSTRTADETDEGNEAAEEERRARHAAISEDDPPPPPATSIRGDAAPMPSGPSSSSTGPAWYAILDDGRELPITGLLLLGRNPAPRPGEEDAELIKVVDEARTVSKTHLSLDVDGTGVVVADRGSTNGSAITDPNGVYQLLTAGQPVRLAADGYLVSVGSHHIRINRR